MGSFVDKSYSNANGKAQVCQLAKLLRSFCAEDTNDETCMLGVEPCLIMRILRRNELRITLENPEPDDT